MYLKLALRNAKRSVFDYLLYIITMIILLTIMLVSNYIAIVGNVQAGFQTFSLTLLIVLILIILVGYVNNFMLKQRAKEFANYMLLGMEKKKLVQMFFIEFSIIGIMCFIVSSIVCIGICFCISEMLFQSENSIKFQLALFLQAFFQTLIYFCIIETISMCFLRNKMYSLEISQLMVEKKKNQNMGGKQQNRFWSRVFAISISSLLIMLLGLTVLPEDIAFMIISVISISLLLTIFAFYKFFFQYMAVTRCKGAC